VIAIAADPSDTEHAFIASQSGVKVTNDGGATWSNANDGLPAKIYALAISPVTSDVAYAASSDAVFETTDNGRRWTRL
jgi:photosystem II stability/assembly factor-like uncharacterized protein